MFHAVSGPFGYAGLWEASVAAHDRGHVLPSQLDPVEKPRRMVLGAPPGWDCRDVKFFIGRISFDQLGRERAAALNAVVTRFKLPPDQVEMLIAAGHDALRNNPTFRNFLKSMPGVQLGPPPATVPKPPRSTPIATSDVKAREASAE